MAVGTWHGHRSSIACSAMGVTTGNVHVRLCAPSFGVSVGMALRPHPASTRGCRGSVHVARLAWGEPPGSDGWVIVDCVRPAIT